MRASPQRGISKLNTLTGFLCRHPNGYLRKLTVTYGDLCCPMPMYASPVQCLPGCVKSPVLWTGLSPSTCRCPLSVGRLRVLVHRREGVSGVTNRHNTRECVGSECNVLVELQTYITTNYQRIQITKRQDTLKFTSYSRKEFAGTN